MFRVSGGSRRRNIRSESNSRQRFVVRAAMPSDAASREEFSSPPCEWASIVQSRATTPGAARGANHARSRATIVRRKSFRTFRLRASSAVRKLSGNPPRSQSRRRAAGSSSTSSVSSGPSSTSATLPARLSPARANRSSDAEPSSRNRPVRAPRRRPRSIRPRRTRRISGVRWISSRTTSRFSRGSKNSPGSRSFARSAGSSRSR